MSRPQHTKAVRTRLASTALGLGAILAVAGCSAGQETQTSSQVAAVDGAHGSAQQVDVRNVQLAFPDDSSTYEAGSSAPLEGGLVNAGSESDRLVEVTSPYAASAEVTGTTVLPAESNLWATPAKQGGGQQPGQQPGQQAPSASSAENAQVHITLRGLNHDIRPGLTVPVTFVFEKAGPTTIQVPLGTSSEERPEHGSPHSDR